MAGNSPTSRSLAQIRERGYQTWIVEYWNNFSRKRVDLFGIFDILAVGNGETLAVQTTSRTNMSARAKKIADSEYIGACREAGWRIEIHGWFKNEKTRRWEVKVLDIS
jgi:hypothetical protein